MKETINKDKFEVLGVQFTLELQCLDCDCSFYFTYEAAAIAGISCTPYITCPYCGKSFYGETGFGFNNDEESYTIGLPKSGTFIHKEKS